MNDIKTLNQHSALVTHNLKKGKYYKLNVEKSIFILLLRSQELLKEHFKKIYLEETKGIFSEKQAKIYLDNFFNRTKVKIESYSQEKLIEKINYINQERINEIDRQILDISEKEKLRKSLGVKSKEIIIKNNLTEDQLNEYLIEIKNYCKSLTIKEHLDSKTINFTTLANSIGAHSTTLKSELKKAMDTVLEFNYINKKNLNIDIVTSLLASVRFIQEKSTTWLEYQIPKEILELLLMPEIYVPLEGVVIGKLNGTYTIRMYSLLRDHLKRGQIELTKEELFNFFTLPNSYSNKTNLIKKFLEPTLEEVKIASGIETNYEFYPNYNYEKITFYPTQKRIVKSELLPIIDKNEKTEIEFTRDIEKYLEKAKKNIFVSKAWNKRVENKLKKIYIENGEEVTIYVLQALYTDLKIDIKASLVKYIEGIVKNYFSENIDLTQKKTLKSFAKTVKEDSNKKDDVISGKKMISVKEYESKLLELINSGMQIPLARKFMNIRYIVEED